MRSGEIAADDEFLSAIQTIFDPGAAPLTRFVVAVLLFSDEPRMFMPKLIWKGRLGRSQLARSAGLFPQNTGRWTSH